MTYSSSGSGVGNLRNVCISLGIDGREDDPSHLESIKYRYPVVDLQTWVFVLAPCPYTFYDFFTFVIIDGVEVVYILGFSMEHRRDVVSLDTMITTEEQPARRAWVGQIEGHEDHRLVWRTVVPGWRSRSFYYKYRLAGKGGMYDVPQL